MNKSYGTTQFAWESLKEDQRLSWKIFSRGVAILASFFVTKTGNTYFDWPLTIITAFFLLTIIETQRAYTKLSPRYRKLFIRIAITLGSWGIAILGAAWFSQASLVAKDHGWYKHPLGTVAQEWTGNVAEPARAKTVGGKSMPLKQKNQQQVEVQVRKPVGKMEH